MNQRQAEIMQKILDTTTASDSGTAAWVREYAALEVADYRRRTPTARVAQFFQRLTPANIRRRRQLARMWRQANDITFTYQRIGAPVPYTPCEPDAVEPCPPGQHYFPLPEELGCDPEVFPGGPNFRGNCACGQPYSTLLDYTDEEESQ